MEKIDNTEKEIRTLKFIIIIFSILLITFAGFYFYEKMLNIYGKCNNSHNNNNNTSIKNEEITQTTDTTTEIISE